MTQKFLLCIFVLLGLSSLGHAGNDWTERGNGGFAMSCKTPRGLDVTTLDIFESQSRYEFSLDVSHSGSVDERVNYLLSKLAVKNPTRAEQYRFWYGTFFKEAQLLENVNMSPVPDIGFGFVPTNCDLQLTIFQRAPGLLNQSRYTINKAIWDRLDAFNQAALIMHELIYREQAMNDSGETSEGARYFNAWLNSNDFQQATFRDYILRMMALHFREADYAGFNVSLNSKTPAGQWLENYLTFYDDSHVEMASVHSSITPAMIQWLPFLANCSSSLGENFYANINFYPDSKIKEIFMGWEPYNECTRHTLLYPTVTGDSIGLKGENWKFGPAGNILEIVGSDKTKGPVFSIAGVRFKLDQDIGVQSYKFTKGKISSLVIPGKVCRNSNMTELTIGNRGWVGEDYNDVPKTNVTEIALDDFARVVKRIPVCTLGHGL